MSEIRPFVFRTEHAGTVTRHALSSGAHYDPDLLSVGPVIGCDEHTLEPGAGFDWHRHRGVVIVSWVLEGVLRHEDSGGDVVHVGPGTALVQSTGAGVRHAETNGSDRTLRFVQTTLLVEAEPSVTTAGPPVVLPGGSTFRVATEIPAGSRGLAVPLDDGVLVVDSA